MRALFAERLRSRHVTAQQVRPVPLKPGLRVSKPSFRALDAFEHRLRFQPITGTVVALALLAQGIEYDPSSPPDPQPQRARLDHRLVTPAPPAAARYPVAATPIPRHCMHHPHPSPHP